MGRTFRAAILLAFLASCGAGSFSAPRNLENACAIVNERPQYFTAMQDAERKWGVPVPVLMAIIYQESKFIGNARTPYEFALGIIPMGRQSSAYGYSQALDGTWDDYREDQNRRGARRDRIADATDFMGWYMVKSRDKLGLSLNDAERQYLAYHEGRTGYARGSQNDKPWLIEVAARVGARSATYAEQLATCT